MKAPSILLTLALSLATPLVWAQDEHHPDAATQNGAGATNEATALQSPMQDRLERMQAVVDQLAQTET